MAAFFFDCLYIEYIFPEYLGFFIENQVTNLNFFFVKENSRKFFDDLQAKANDFP